MVGEEEQRGQGGGKRGVQTAIRGGATFMERRMSEQRRLVALLPPFPFAAAETSSERGGNLRSVMISDSYRKQNKRDEEEGERGTRRGGW